MLQTFEVRHSIGETTDKEYVVIAEVWKANLDDLHLVGVGGYDLAHTPTPARCVAAVREVGHDDLYVIDVSVHGLALTPMPAQDILESDYRESLRIVYQHIEECAEMRQIVRVHKHAMLDRLLICAQHLEVQGWSLSADLETPPLCSIPRSAHDMLQSLSGVIALTSPAQHVTILTAICPVPCVATRQD